MDYLEPPAYTETPSLPNRQPSTVIKDSLPQLRDRRREKPLLSCTFCRNRKVRCDRQLPCKTCTNRGIGLSCTYEAGCTSRGKSKVSVGDRIQQLEELVHSLARQQQTPVVHADSLVRESSDPPSQQSISTIPLTTLEEETLVPASKNTPISQSKDGTDSPRASEPGSMRLNSHGVGASYVGSVHWAAVLDSISELRDHYEEQEEARLLATNDHLFLHSPGPRLLYEPVQTTKADLLASVPARPVVDRMVASLILGQYTRGGEYVLETLINYLICESFMSQEDETGLWLVQGIIVQLALSQGYHRDPHNFPSITPFSGEMRRRVWAAIVQLDLRLSSQMALPCVLKAQQYDTAEPRNLLDTDFDEDTIDLPPSRPETEVTPVLYSLAKGRIDKMMGLVNDIVNDTKEHPYTEIVELDWKLQEAEASLPPIFKWQPLSQSFMVAPEIIMHRVLLQLAIQRLTIWLHRKYLAPSYTHTCYQHSRKACVQAAIKVLEFQQIVLEETQGDGLLYPTRWARWMLLSSRPRAVFLLGVSILCYYVQLTKSRPGVSLDESTGSKIHGLLRNAYPLWLHSTTVSREARRAIDYLSFRLGLQEQEIGVPLADSTAETPQDTDMSLDQFTWDAYEETDVFSECIAGFPTTAFSGGFMGLDLSSATSVSTSDLFSKNLETPDSATR
ncbi:hypothetical protein BFJ68_g1463 [Fusarium oxysporum]|uniref:Zn(2)-C6 fungal-type domain-containing protein n=1 Tax=Fusarium oxysporum TaxID=5507 RepID=A0A420S1U4_FUSOX|nr:hypothetical protein BFJ68_g1463 [Fusarium oxysporum]